MDEPQQDATPEKAVEAEETWPIWAAPFLENYRRGTPDISRAAKSVDVARSTVYRLRDRDEAFKLALFDAREEALDFLEGNLYALGTSGLATKKTVTKRNAAGEVLETTETEDIVRYAVAGMFILKRYRPEFRESFRVEQTGAGGGPIQHEVSLVDDLAASARSELDRLQVDLTTDLIPIGDVDS